ncbi:MAG: tagaturonate reductase [Ferruginibacter sp.]
MMKLSKKNILSSGTDSSKELAAVMELPEKVLQFGTGVLLRGLPDYFIDKANKQGLFNGRVVIVKSTDGGDFNAFREQDGLYTQAIRGIENGKEVSENIINASVSRVLSAKAEWNEILACAANPDMQIVISNTTEVGIQLLDNDDMNAAPPESFPCKLLAFLYKRFQVFNGDPEKGMVILPTELIIGNADKLKSIVLQLAAKHNLQETFINWLNDANHFCNTLVDRIVPGKLSAADKSEVETVTGFTDDLMIISECYALWAIESDNKKVKDALSFSTAVEGVVIAANIDKFRELKLRLLNGTHTFTSGLAYIAGITTVKEAMDNELIAGFAGNIMISEIAPQIINEDLTNEEASKFAMQVLDRFRNPRIQHLWLNITVQYSMKMKMRNVPLLLNHYSRSNEVPELMATGFAAHILFMKCEKSEDGKYYGTLNNASYPVQDDYAGWYQTKWQEHGTEGVVEYMLNDAGFWGSDLAKLPGFAAAVQQKLNYLINGDIYSTVKNHQPEKATV